jgi:hypothetical protein
MVTVARVEQAAFLYVLWGMTSLAPPAVNAQATWPSDPTQNVPICTKSGDQEDHHIAGDGAGGSIITWVDFKNLGNMDNIWAQNVDSRGAVRWRNNGVPVSIADGFQVSPYVVPDGRGGAIVAWYDTRVEGTTYGRIYAQHLNRNGLPTWRLSGVLVDTTAFYAYPLQTVSDYAGGAVLVYSDSRADEVRSDIYAQRLSFDGRALWQLGGVPVCTTLPSITLSSVTPDGSGGVIACWTENRVGDGFEEVYVQRIDGTGRAVWTTDGVQVWPGPARVLDPSVLTDGSGGAFAASSAGSMIYVQHVAADGTFLWGPTGVAVTDSVWYVLYPRMVFDGAGGIILVWQDARGIGYGYTAYAQRVSASGTPLWMPNGVPLSPLTSSIELPEIASDGQGGAIVTWQDYRLPGESDIYAQRILPDGTIASGWPNGGAPVCTANGLQQRPVILAVPEGAIIAWQDRRNAYVADIYAQRILLNGQLGAPTRMGAAQGGVPNTLGEESTLIRTYLSAPVPNPSQGVVSIRYTLARPGSVRVVICDATGRLMRVLHDAVQGAGDHQATWDLRDERGAAVADGVYVCCLIFADGTNAHRRFTVVR